METKRGGGGGGGGVIMVVVLKSVRKFYVGSRGFFRCYSLLPLEMTLCMLEKNIVEFPPPQK